MSEQSPRYYAFKYLKATNQEDKDLLVAQCPDDWRALVRKHLELFRDRTRAGNLVRVDPVPKKREKGYYVGSVKHQEMKRIAGLFDQIDDDGQILT